MESSAARGSVAQQTFEQVQALLREGLRPTEAFARLSEQTGRSAATIATAYYRAARKAPGGGGVKQRPRSKAGRAAASSNKTPSAAAGATTQALVRDVLAAADRLAKHAEQLEQELRSARADSELLAKLKRIAAQ